jgi:hypothetical protein
MNILYELLSNDHWILCHHFTENVFHGSELQIPNPNFHQERDTESCKNSTQNNMTWAKVALRAIHPKQAVIGPKRNTFQNRGSINTSHHKNCDHRNLRIVLQEKPFLSQRVFNTKILHFTTSIFLQNYLTSFFTKKLQK